MRCCQNFWSESTLPMPTSWKTCSMTSGKGVWPSRASRSTAKRSSLVNLRQYSWAMSVRVSRTLSLAHSKPVCARMVAMDWYRSCRQEDQLSSVTGSPFPLKNRKDKNSTLSKNLKDCASWRDAVNNKVMYEGRAGALGFATASPTYEHYLISVYLLFLLPLLQISTSKFHFPF